VVAVREIRTNQDDVADSISITATVGEILFNGTKETRPSEIFFVESLYELSSTVPNQRHTRCYWPVLACLDSWRAARSWPRSQSPQHLVFAPRKGRPAAREVVDDAGINPD